ncbi:MAG: hypothetical protein M1823_004830 [Watsoniomyces obsoletus]|nr:MAG: hypothetical protein M1823_004830 [Watsoniomyces obsoletus]
MSGQIDLEARRRDENAREMVRMWRCWRVLHEMMRDRGYELTEDEVHLPFDTFVTRYADDSRKVQRKRMTFSARPSQAMIEKHSTPPTAAQPNPPPPNIGTIWIEFYEEMSIGIKQMRQFAHHVNEGNFHTGILVTPGSVTPAGLKLIPTVLPAVIETFVESDIVINITHHELVPPHILLSKEEKTALLQKYRLKESQLPRIQVSDPIARYYGFKRGQVIKVVRKSETAGRYQSYRWVV